MAQHVRSPKRTRIGRYGHTQRGARAHAQGDTGTCIRRRARAYGIRDTRLVFTKHTPNTRLHHRTYAMVRLHRCGEHSTRYLSTACRAEILLVQSSSQYKPAGTKHRAAGARRGLLGRGRGFDLGQRGGRSASGR
eukprot:2038483-Rhodomonas_salina.7